jgi:hypothetical protein
MVGYSYAGFIKAVKENSINHEARMKLNKILDIPLDDIVLNSPNFQFSEKEANYKKITLVDELKHINSMLMEQLKVKDMQIAMLTELLKNNKGSNGGNKLNKAM